MKPYETTHLDELERIPVMEGLEWRPIRRRLGGEAFGVNAYTAEKPGAWVVEEHNEAQLQHREVYMVVRGRATFTLGGETLDAPAGTIVYIEDPQVTRKAVAEEEGTTVLAIGAKPGEPYEPSIWEWYFEAYAKSPEEGIAIMEDAARIRPEHPAVWYHLACIEMRAGREAGAREHLARAIELRPELREQARGDDDLKAIAP